MAINPNILLQPITPDIGGSLIRGLQGAQAIQGLRQAAQEAPLRQQLLQTQAKLAPLQQQLLQSQIEAAPLAIESQRLENLTKQQKMTVQGTAIAYNSLLPFLRNNDFEGAAKAVQSNRLIDDDDKQKMLGFIQNKDLGSILGEIGGVTNLAQQMGIFEVPKTATESDASIKLRLAGIEPGTEAARQALFPPQAQAPVSNEVLRQKDVKEKINIALADLNNLRDQKLINETDYQFLKGQINVGQFDSYAGALRNIAGQVPSTDAQKAAQDAVAGQAMVNFAANKQLVVDGAKDLRAVKNDYFNQLSTARSTRNLYQEALKQLDAGAGTGFLESRLPNLTDAAALLENTRQQIGLGVLTDSKLTPVSNADLQVVMNAAIPFEAGEEAVKQWVKDKIAAYDRLIPVLDKGVRHFEAGKSMSSWLDESTWGRQASPTPGTSDVPVPPPTPAMPANLPTPDLNAPVDLVYDRASGTFVSPGGRR